MKNGSFGIGRILPSVILFLMLVAGILNVPPSSIAEDVGSRHQYIRDNGIPASYAELRNPLEAAQSNIAKGAAIYRETCKSCHGTTGKGDGENGFYFNPKPSDLTPWAEASNKSPDGVLSSDQYLFWTISEGEAGLFETSMTAFKSKLTEIERWQLILFIRHGL